LNYSIKKYENMKKLELTNEELLAELKRRFDLNNSMLMAEKSLTTQLNAVNEKLIFSEDLKTNFLSNIRNEINNPIASILELSKNILEGNMDTDSMKRFGMLIHSEAFDLDFQFKNIFLSADIEAGESPLSVISVNVGSILNNIISSFSYRMEKKKINVSFDNQIDSKAFFHTDSEKFHLIMSNLLANAITFNREGGSIKIIAKIEDDQLIISVQDTGISISDKNKERIYDRFLQLDSGSVKTYGGHGLGLTVTKAMLEIIQGEISLDTEEGIGSKFMVTINQFKNIGEGSGISSTDGNDFLFGQEEDGMLF